MKEEEDSFLRTLETGIRLLDTRDGRNAVPPARPSSDGVGSLHVVSTPIGFPLDLTELILP